MPHAWSPAEIRAGALVALLLFGTALWDARGARSDATASSCLHPRELAAHAGHTRRVRCDADLAGSEVRGPARILFGLGIDPNRADAAALEALPGVGPSRAAAIVAGRASAPYRVPTDLLRVHGIGPVTLRRVVDWLAFPDAERARAETGSLPRSPRERLP
jgi:hypothetical protein